MEADLLTQLQQFDLGSDLGVFLLLKLHFLINFIDIVLRNAPLVFISIWVIQFFNTVLLVGHYFL